MFECLPHAITTVVVVVRHRREHLAVKACAVPVMISDKTVRPELSHLQVKLIIFGEISIIELDVGREFCVWLELEKV